MAPTAKPVLRSVNFRFISQAVTIGSSPAGSPSHLYIVAGYPGAGKTSILLKAARERIPLFGGETVSVIPPIETLRGLRERSDTRAKLVAGFWVTLADIPQLNEEVHLPRQLVMHLDLLLTHLRYQSGSRSIPQPDEVQASFARLFAEPALRRFEKCTVTTLVPPLEELQRRWRHRHQAKVPPAGKHRLIMDGKIAAPAYAAIHLGWERQLEALAESGKLAGRFRGETRLRQSNPIGVQSRLMDCLHYLVAFQPFLAALGAEA